MADRKLRSKILTELSKKSEFPLTEKRMLIIDEICANPNFGDIEEIWLAVRAKYGISRATVNSTIMTMVKTGLIRKEKANSYGYLYYLNQHHVLHQP